jgi:hypothetical protein
MPTTPTTLLTALALVVAGGSASAQQRVGAPESSPRLRRMMELERQLTAGDSAALDAYLRSAAAPELLAARPAGALVAELLRATRPLGPVEIPEVEPVAPGAARGRIAAGGRTVGTITIRIEPEPPHRFLGIQLAPGGAGRSDAPPAALTPAMQQVVVDSIARLIERVYTAPDTGRMIGDRLRRRVAAGAYRALTQPQAFAEAVGEDMRAVNGDKHLRVTVGNPGARPRPAGAAATRQGFEPVERLRGNVGNLRLTGPMSGSPAALDAATSALRELATADAVILDLRGVPGGSGEMSNHIISHFTAPDLPSLVVYDRITGQRRIRHTLSTVPGPRRTDVPLYVLVDRRTFSAGEDLPFVLQSLGRATIVGERTGGGGRNNMFVPVGHGLTASVTFTRVSDPKTGREWEGVGVQPDLPVPADQALDAAHRHALARLGQAGG